MWCRLALQARHIDWGLRDYSVEGQLGLEKTPEEYVAKMVVIFRELRRVLRDDGTLWLNMGDSYAGGGRGGDPKHLKGDNSANATMESYKEIPAKNLIGMPWKVAFALQDNGWILRSDIIWNKKNPMPESCTDRPTKAHEYLFLLLKKPKYYYDNEAIREKADTLPHKMGGVQTSADRNDGDRQDVIIGDGNRNRRSVWTIATEPYPEAHFATFPQKLVEPCVLAGTSEKGCCPECGRCWVRVVEIEDSENRLGKGYHDHKNDLQRGQRGVYPAEGKPISKTIGWRPACECNASEPVPCVVLDPFMGSGTVALVALRANRKFIGIELNQDYIDMAYKRIEPLLNQGKLL